MIHSNSKNLVSTSNYLLHEESTTLFLSKSYSIAMALDMLLAVLDALCPSGLPEPATHPSFLTNLELVDCSVVIVSLPMAITMLHNKQTQSFSDDNNTRHLDGSADFVWMCLHQNVS